MSDLNRLKAWLDEGVLVSPLGEAHTIVDLGRAVLRVAGAGGSPVDDAPEELVDLLGGREHLVFVLIDGLGAEVLRRCAPSGFMSAHVVGELRSVFPSTTAAALTSFATADYPAQHGVPGWWVFLEEHDLTATVLPYQERFSHLDLQELGVDPGHVFQRPSLLPRVERSVLSVTPQAFLQDVYLRYSTGGTPAGGYEEPRGAFQRVIEHILGAGGPTYTSVYLPHVDAAAHGHGVDSAQVRQAVKELDALVGWLKDRLRDEARIVVTGDHGHVPLSPERVIYLDEGDEMLGLLRCPPTGEATVPYFHVHPGQLDAFADRFRERYPNTFALLTPDEMEGLELLGPAPLAPTTRRRLGNLVGIASEPTALIYRRRGEDVTPHLGVHAGLTPGEMVVPLIVA